MSLYPTGTREDADNQQTYSSASQGVPSTDVAPVKEPHLGSRSNGAEFCLAAELLTADTSHPERPSEHASLSQ